MQWASLSLNAIEQALPLTKRVPEQLPNMIATVPPDMRNDSAAIQVTNPNRENKKLPNYADSNSKPKTLTLHSNPNPNHKHNPNPKSKPKTLTLTVPPDMRNDSAAIQVRVRV